MRNPNLNKNNRLKRNLIFYKCFRYIKKGTNKYHNIFPNSMINPNNSLKDFFNKESKDNLVIGNNLVFLGKDNEGEEFLLDVNKIY